MEFEKAVDAKGNIEVWLQRLVDSMQDTVKQTIKRAVRNVYEMGLEDFIFGHPAQVGLLNNYNKGGSPFQASTYRPSFRRAVPCLELDMLVDCHSYADLQPNVPCAVAVHIVMLACFRFADQPPGHPVPMDSRHTAGPSFS